VKLGAQVTVGGPARPSRPAAVDDCAQPLVGSCKIGMVAARTGGNTGRAADARGRRLRPSGVGGASDVAD